MQSGATYGEIYDRLAEDLDSQAAAMRVGAMLGRWLNEGLVAEISR